MRSPSQVVIDFLTEIGRDKSSMQDAFRTYLTPDTVWENVKIATTVGIDQALALMQGFEDNFSIVTFRSSIVSIAENGNKVLTEREEWMIDAQGNQKKQLRLMGVFELEGEKIVAWRDYTDPNEDYS